MALFMDEKNAEEAWKNPGDDPDLLAMRSMMEEPPEETAERSKEQGNLALKKGKKYWKEALQYYTDAIDCNSEIKSNSSIYYSNRAHVHFLLENYGHALSDSKKAIELNQTNIKAYFRAAKSAFAVRSFEAAKGFCEKGLTLDEGNTELGSILKQSELRLNEEAQRTKRANDVIDKAEAISKALSSRSIRLGQFLFKDHTKGKKPWLDSSGLLHWPVVFLYGQVMSSDFVEDFCETDLFINHLEVIFGEDSPPLPWDVNREYTADTVELYYQTNSTKQLKWRQVTTAMIDDVAGMPDECRARVQDMEQNDEAVDWTAAGEMKWVKVDRRASLNSVLSQAGHVIPGIPVFFVVARETSFRKLFLSGAWSPP